jgi:hypothetical protein
MVEMTQAREIAERAIDAGFAEGKGKLVEWLASRIVGAAEEGKVPYLSIETDTSWMDSDYCGLGFTVQTLREAQKLV